MAAQSMTASDFLVEYYEKGGNETLLVPTGPLTNVALALQREPALATRVPGIVMMGGAYAEGNATASAEFNIYADPEAARIVFRSGIPMTMVGLEVTAQALVTMEDAGRIRELGTPASRVAADLIAEQVQWFVDHLGCSGGQIYDACAVAACIDPDVITTQAMHVDIELYGELTRGRTVCDSSGLHGRAPNVDVGMEIDRDRFLALMMRSLAEQ
jgi:inosine-uridine nucleoside N-ribohydrolase